MHKTKDKSKLIDLLVKRKTDPTTTYSYIERETGYRKQQIIRINKELENKDIEELKIHGNTGKKPKITASETEIEYIKKFKEQYPKITIAQFKDIYDEDIINNPDRKEDIEMYHLKTRSISFFNSLFKRFGWKSIVKHRKNAPDKPLHHMRSAMPREGMLIQIDGTPFDWLGTGENWCLHLAIDDATKKIIAGWFVKNECLYGYLKIVEIMIKEYGIPIAMYSDKHSIFMPKDEIEGHTKFQLIMDRLGVDTIKANSSQAKGRVERYNGTCQRRLPNDIKRNHIDNYDQLNKWFNNTYKHYLNNKFKVTPYDDYSEFVPVDETFDYIEKLSIEVERTIRNGFFSYEESLFYPTDPETGEIIDIRSGVKVTVIHDILNRQVYLKRFGRLLPCLYIRDNHYKNVVDNKKELMTRIGDFIEKKGR